MLYKRTTIMIYTRTKITIELALHSSLTPTRSVNYIPKLDMVLIQLLLLSYTVTSSVSQVVPDCPDRGGKSSSYRIYNRSIIVLETVCFGHSTSRKSRAGGSTVVDILHDAYDQFCGCRYVQDNVVIQTLSGLPDVNEPLVERNFSFLYHVREISGYLEFNNIPPIARLSLPNLRLIRGNTLRSIRSIDYGLVVNGRIQSLYMPNLTEVIQGSVFILGSNTEPSLCNVKSVNWTDIAPSNNTIESSGCSVTGKSQSRC